MVPYTTMRRYTHQCYTQSPSVSLHSTPPSRREAIGTSRAPSPTNLIYALLAGGASPSPTATDFATQNQLHLCIAQTSLRSNFTCAKHKLHCTVTSLSEAKLHRTVRCISPATTPTIKAASRRLLSFLLSFVYILTVFSFFLSIFGNTTINIIVQSVAAVASAIASAEYTPTTPINIGKI